MMWHQEPIQVGGVRRSCPTCAVDRDFLVLCSGDWVWLRCRGGHEWPEPALDAAWYDRNSGPLQSSYPDQAAAFRAFGFDGSLAGIVL
jgi:hypothetical protein